MCTQFIWEPSLTVAKCVAEKAVYMDEKSNYMAENAKHMAENAKYLAEKGKYLAEMGKYLAERAKYVAAIAIYVAENAKYVTERANHMAEKACLHLVNPLLTLTLSFSTQVWKIEQEAKLKSFLPKELVFPQVCTRFLSP